MDKHRQPKKAEPKTSKGSEVDRNTKVPPQAKPTGAEPKTHFVQLIDALQNKPWIARILVVYLVLKACGDVWSVTYSACLWLRDSSRNAISQGDLGAFMLTTSAPVIVKMGGFHSKVRLEDIQGVKHISDVLGIKMEPITSAPLSLSVDGTKLSVNAEFVSESGKVGIIQNSKWTERLDGFDMNFNHNSLEVVDDQLEPILQLHFAQTNVLYVGGYFLDSKGNKSVFTPDKTVKDGEAPVRKLFKYPSYKFPHKLAVTIEYLISVFGSEEHIRNFDGQRNRPGMPARPNP